MRIKKLRIQNFRGFRDTTITFEDYTCLVGQNGSGKSAVLAALNVLFRSSETAGWTPTNLGEEDFFQRITDEPVVITATFVGLTAVESQDLSQYTREGDLTIKAIAEWSPTTRSAPIKQFGSRLACQSFESWFKASKSGSSVADLRELYRSLRDKRPQLPNESTKAGMDAALHTYEMEHPDECHLVDFEEQFYGWTTGENKLSKYIQWVYVPAVKDASTEQFEGKTTALGELLERTIRQKVDFDSPLAKLREEMSNRYQLLLDEHQIELESVSFDLARRLQQWSHHGAKLALQWNNDREKSVVIGAPLAKVLVGEGLFVGELCRLGHGLQRSFLIAVLQELTDKGSSASPQLLLGFEEPELYQHPPQARHLATLLQQLATRDAQVIITTHSPYFVSASMLTSVRLLRRHEPDGSSRVGTVDGDTLTARLAAALGEDPPIRSELMASLESILQPSQNEMFFCGYPVIVEGLEDVAYLVTYLKLADHWDAFRSNGGHMIVATGKTNLSRPLAICQQLGLPCYVVFDADGNEKRAEQRQRNERDNQCLIRLLAVNDIPSFPQAPVVNPRVTVWPENIHRSVRADFGDAEWDNAQNAARAEYELHSVKGKNPQLIVATIEQLWRNGHRSTLLNSVVKAILSGSQRPEIEERC